MHIMDVWNCIAEGHTSDVIWLKYSGDYGNKYQVISGHMELYSSLNNCILQRLNFKGQIENIDKPYNQIMQILTVPSAGKIWQWAIR